MAFSRAGRWGSFGKSKPCGLQRRRVGVGAGALAGINNSEASMDSEDSADMDLESPVESLATESDFESAAEAGSGDGLGQL